MNAYRNSRNQRPGKRMGPSNDAREGYALKLTRAEELGFTEAQAPFIAAAALVRPKATVRQLRLVAETQFPWLWENPAQGCLFDEGVA